jgi:dTDP-4-dehydrorhamnose reductase
MKNIFVTGYKGRIGKLLIARGLRPLHCDVTSASDVKNSIDKSYPDLIIHLASESDVNFCELEENQYSVTNKNFDGSRNVFFSAYRGNIPVVWISSDHLFGGKKGKYKENANPSPLNYYGLLKLSIEAMTLPYNNVKTIRTSYIFDVERLKNQFLPPYEYPTFLSRSFIYTQHFTDALMYYISNFDKMPKVLNISGNKIASWYEFALACASVFRVDKHDIHPRRKELKQEGLAPRPYKAGLDVGLSKRLGLPQFSYLDGIRQMKSDKNLIELGYNI